MGREQDLLVIKLPKPSFEGRKKSKMVGKQARWGSELIQAVKIDLEPGTLDSGS